MDLSQIEQTGLVLAQAKRTAQQARDALRVAEAALNAADQAEKNALSHYQTACREAVDAAAGGPINGGEE